MSTTEHAILCGSCKCAVKTVANPQAHDQVACPRCGRTDRYDQVVKTVGEYIVHLTHKSLAERISRTTRPNSFIKFEMKKPSNRSFRWVAENVGV